MYLGEWGVGWDRVVGMGWWGTNVMTSQHLLCLLHILKCGKEAEDGASYCGEMGLQTRYSKLLQQPRVKGLTPP